MANTFDFGAFNKKTAVIPIILCFLLYAVDLMMGFQGIPISSFQKFPSFLASTGRVILAFLGAGVLIYYLFKIKNAAPATIVTFSITLFLALCILFFGGGKTIPHLLGLVFIFITLEDGTSWEAKSVWFSILLIYDFIIQSAINLSAYGVSQGTLIFVFPLYGIYAFSRAASYEYYPFLKGFYTVFAAGLILAAPLYTLEKISVYNQMKTMDPDMIKNGVQGYFGKVFTNIGMTFSTMGSGFVQLFNTSAYAPSGNQEEVEDPQGVFLKELEGGDIRFSEGSPVYVFARLEAKVLDKPIDVTITCNTSIETDTGIEEIRGIVDEESKAEYMTVPVFSGVERTVPCIFSQNTGNPLKEGSYDIKYYAKFDFAADSRLKIYMMERNRLINDFVLLQDKGLEPTKENVLLELYDIKDTTPVSIFTSGPLELDIGTEKVPWDLALTNNIRPSIGVAMKNIWESNAKIESINTIYLKVPDTMTLTGADCLGIPLAKEPSNSPQAEAGYNVYSLKPGWTDIKDYVGLKCPITIATGTLDNVPVTTRFLKAHVDYTYLLEESTSLDVDPALITGDPQEAIENS